MFLRMRVNTALKSLFLLTTVLALGNTPSYAAAPASSKQSPPSMQKGPEAVSLMAHEHPFIQALVHTYDTSPALKAALKDQYALAEALPKALSGFRPNLAFEASSSRAFEENQNTRRKSYATSHSGKLTLNQSLFAGGGTIAAVSAAEAQILSGYAAFAKAEQDVMLASVTAYVNLWLRRFVKDLNDKNVSVKEKTLEQAVARQEVGDLTSTDIAQARSELALARSRQIEAQSNVLQAEENYHRTVGQMPPKDLSIPSEVSTFFELPSDKMSFIKYAQDNNPTAVNSRFSELQARHNIDVARADLLPKLSMSGSLSRNLTSDESGPIANSRTNSGSVGLTLTVPLYTGGSKWSTYRENRQRATQAKLNFRNTSRVVREEAVQAWERYHSAKNQIHHLGVQVEAAERSLLGVREEAFVGQRIFLEVLEAENKLLEAQTQEAEAKANHLIQSYTLLNSLGHLTATGLQLPVEQYPLKAYVDTLRSTWIGTVADPQKVQKD